MTWQWATIIIVGLVLMGVLSITSHRENMARLQIELEKIRPRRGLFGEVDRPVATVHKLNPSEEEET